MYFCRKFFLEKNYLNADEKKLNKKHLEIY